MQGVAVTGSNGSSNSSVVSVVTSADASCSAQALKQLCQDCHLLMTSYVVVLAEFYTAFARHGMGGDIEDISIGIGSVIAECAHGDILAALRVCLRSTVDEIDKCCCTAVNPTEAVKSIKGLTLL